MPAENSSHYCERKLLCGGIWIRGKHFDTAWEAADCARGGLSDRIDNSASERYGAFEEVNRSSPCSQARCLTAVRTLTRVRVCLCSQSGFVVAARSPLDGQLRRAHDRERFELPRLQTLFAKTVNVQRIASPFQGEWAFSFAETIYLNEVAAPPLQP